MSEQRLDAYCDYFESLTPASLERAGDYFAPEARFCDPFNDVFGVSSIKQVFAHMFATTTAPRFEVNERLLQGRIAYLRWRFYFLPRGRHGEPWCIEGVSRVSFSREGLVEEHVDYWDPAAQLYARIPVLGGLMRWLRRRLAAD